MQNVNPQMILIIVPGIFYYYLKERNPESNAVRWLGYYLKFIGFIFVASLLGVWSLPAKGLAGVVGVLAILAIFFAMRRYNLKNNPKGLRFLLSVGAVCVIVGIQLTIDPPKPHLPGTGRYNNYAANSYEGKCREKMTAYAETKNVDPDSYIASNQEYLAKCIRYYENAKNP